MIIRELCEGEWDSVAELVFNSTNDWYRWNPNRACFPEGKSVPLSDLEVRPAVMADVDELVALEEKISGIRRRKDFLYFIENEAGIWRGYVHESSKGIQGFLFSVDHPGSRMLGPGVSALKSSKEGL